MAVATARPGFDSQTGFLKVRSASSHNLHAGMEALTPAAFSLLEALYDEPDATHEPGHPDEAFEVVHRLQSSSAAIALQEFSARLAEQNPSKRKRLLEIQALGRRIVPPRRHAGRISVRQCAAQ
jgi:hypothetical protein